MTMSPITLPLCNRRPERAPNICGYVFPLCWRCSSIAAGLIIIGALPEKYLMPDTGLLGLGLGACLVAVLDGYLSNATIYGSTNIRRMVTGLGAGLGLGYVLSFFQI